jgi:hypothetical protein
MQSTTCGQVCFLFFVFSGNSSLGKKNKKENNKAHFNFIIHVYDGEGYDDDGGGGGDDDGDDGDGGVNRDGDGG